MNFESRGYYCIGAAPVPAGHAAFVEELCPYKMQLDLGTAHVVRGVRGIVRIDPRCVACSAKRRVCRQLQKRRGHDVLSGRGDSLRGACVSLFAKNSRVGNVLRYALQSARQVRAIPRHEARSGE